MLLLKQKKPANLMEGFILYKVYITPQQEQQKRMICHLFSF